LALQRQKIDEKLASIGPDKLRFYDGTTHQRLFLLDKVLRHSLEKNGAVVTSTEQIKEDMEPGTFTFREYTNIFQLSPIE
jgi:hypothetical protein